MSEEEEEEDVEDEVAVAVVVLLLLFRLLVAGGGGIVMAEIPEVAGALTGSVTARICVDLSNFAVTCSSFTAKGRGIYVGLCEYVKG